MRLVIGDKAWSSWSMRPWLVLRRAGADFTEELVGLRRPESAQALAATGSPAGLVPLLHDGDLMVWDSLAICEYVVERFPAAGLWPSASHSRALARSASAQMHSGFAALRGEMPMELNRRERRTPSAAVADDLRRLDALWSHVRRSRGVDGPFLLGEWGVVDAMFTPVATRLRTYGVTLEGQGLDPWGDGYAARLLAEPEFLAWEQDAASPVAL